MAKHWTPETLRAWRTSAGLTITQFAYACGVCEKSVYLWESGFNSRGNPLQIPAHVYPVINRIERKIRRKERKK